MYVFLDTLCFSLTFRQNSQTCSLCSLQYSSGYGLKYHVSISYRPSSMDWIFFTCVSHNHFQRFQKVSCYLPLLSPHAPFPAPALLGPSRRFLPHPRRWFEPHCIFSCLGVSNGARSKRPMVFSAEERCRTELRHRGITSAELSVVLSSSSMLLLSNRSNSTHSSSRLLTFNWYVREKTQERAEYKFSKNDRPRTICSRR